MLSGPYICGIWFGAGFGYHRRMADPADVALNKLIRSEFGKRMIDTTAADLRCTHGVVYIRGSLRPIKGGPTDLRAEVELIGRILRQRAGVRDVVIDCSFRS
jgi:hypothetical protein